MAEETVVEAPAAVEAPPSLDIPRSNTPEYQQWRETGELPGKQEKAATEESPTSDAVKEPADDKGDSAPTKTQETKRKPDVEARFKEYSDRIKRLETELEQARTKPKEDSAPSKPEQPQNYQEWRKTFKATQWVENYGKENPEASFEDANAAMFDYMGDIRDQFRVANESRDKSLKEMNSKVSEAKSRYENFDEVTRPFVDTLTSDTKIPAAVRAMVDDSEVFADLAFTLAGDAKFLDMARNEPGKALRYIAKVETLIEAELSGKGAEVSTDRNEKGQFTPKIEPPVKRGPESVPPPPEEIGARGSGPVDDTEQALKSIQAGDPKKFRQWMDAENKKDMSRRNGA